MNVRPVLRWAVDASSDESPYRSRLRAVWVPDRSVSSIRHAPAAGEWNDDSANLVEVTAAFTWAA